MTKFNKIAIFIFAIVSICMVSCEPEGFPEDLAPDNTLDTTNQISFQYCTDKIESAAGQDTEVGNIYKQSAAIRITADQLSTFASNRMIKILVGLPLHGETPSKNFKDLTVWIRTDLKSNNIWEQKYEGKLTLGKWHEVLMAPYFKINGEALQDLYIGYTINADRLIMGGDGSLTPNEEATYIFDWSTRKWINYPGIGNLSIKAIFSGENMPKNDLSILSLKAPNYIKPGSPFSVVGIVRNELINEIESFDLVVKSGNKKVQKHVSLSWPIRKGEKMIFFAENIKLSESSANEVEYYIENLNGSERDDNKKNSTVKVTSVISNNLVERVTLLENTTGDRCGACPQGHKYLEESIKELGEEHFIWVAHHAGFNQGKYTSAQSDSVARLFYDTPTGMAYAPGLMIDRTNLLSVGVVTSDDAVGPIFMLNEAGEKKRLSGYMNVMQTNYSPINLDVQRTYNETTRELSLTIKGDIISKLSEGDEADLVAILVEDNLKGTQTGAGPGDYYHNHVCRDGITSIFGNKLKISNNKFEVKATKKLDKKFNVDNLSVVVWVSNRPKDRYDSNGHIVYQAAKVSVK